MLLNFLVPINIAKYLCSAFCTHQQPIVILHHCKKKLTIYLVQILEMEVYFEPCIIYQTVI